MQILIVNLWCYSVICMQSAWVSRSPIVYRELNSNIFASQVPCHKMKNCKNGGKTIIYLKDGPGSDPYRCECPKGFSGDLCQIGELLKTKNSYQAMLKIIVLSMFAWVMQFQHETVHCMYNNYSIRSIQFLLHASVVILLPVLLCLK
jgi:hypothetical protein